MNVHRLAGLLVVVSACAPRTQPQPVATTISPAVVVPERAIRRDIPMTNTIRRALASGTRDSTGRPGRNYWQNRVDYVIDARLDVATNRVLGRETITIHNDSDTALTAVVLRLDQNINTAHGARLGPRPTDAITSGMRVTRMTVNGQSTTLVPPRLASGSARPTNPAAYLLHTTVARVTLASPIASKGRATMEIDWEFEVPGTGGIRMGRFADTLYQVAQWYPRVTVYDDLRGWDMEPYLGNAEFYNNFGRFDVSIDVPAGWLVGATGVLQNADAVLSAETRRRLARALETDSVVTVVGVDDRGVGKATAAGERLVWRFVADSVNDFAWATSKAYVWDATRALIPGRAPVPVHLLYQPGRASMFKPAAPVSRHALEFYSRLWFRYPFPQLTLADGPELGMEYPMFIMSAVGAADHEVGHEWWPMVVSNNETWYGWMDEGFNQYMNILSEADFAKRRPVLDGVGQVYGRTSGAELESPMMWPANYQGSFYGFTTYFKTPAMLSMLGGIVGDSAVARAMRDWATAWKYRHPSPWDYMFFMNDALGQDLGWFWYYWLFTTEAVHGSIESASPNVGQGITGPANVVIRQDGQMPSPIVLQVKLAPTGAPVRSLPNARMTDSVTAIVTYPVDVWFTGSRTFRATLDFGRPIQSITLDPFRRFPDRDARDNVWPR
jgi:hypothetical protein